MMNDADRKQIRQRAMMLQRASEAFARFGALIPMAIAFVRGWPLEVELYPHWQVGESWKVFLGLFVYWLAALALERSAFLAVTSLDE